jgi:hypothetical protein
MCRPNQGRGEAFASLHHELLDDLLLPTEDCVSNVLFGIRSDQQPEFGRQYGVEVLSLVLTALADLPWHQPGHLSPLFRLQLFRVSGGDVVLLEF